MTSGTALDGLVVVMNVIRRAVGMLRALVLCGPALGGAVPITPVALRAGALGRGLAPAVPTP
jgi:hypothetical protein